MLLSTRITQKMIGKEISTGLNDYHFRIRSATDTATVGVVFLQFAVRKKKKRSSGVGWRGVSVPNVKASKHLKKINYQLE